jgi:serine/threonine protein kinase
LSETGGANDTPADVPEAAGPPQSTVPPSEPSFDISSPIANVPTRPEHAMPHSDPFGHGSGYQLLKCLGRGGFGEVWHAEAPGGIEIAVKVIYRSLNPAEAQRELESLELIKGLRHPFLVQTHAYWQLEDRLVIAMELADGNLLDRQKECEASGLPGIPLDELLGYFREAAEALDYLHSKRVLHRDIKPVNILLLNRHAKVADFGLARMLETQKSMTSMTTSGTPLYMAPDVWRGRVNERSDQYSLALTYAELRLSHRIFPSGGMFELMQYHLVREPELNPLPEAEQAVLRRALAKDPELRYPSCGAFIQELQLAAERERITTEIGRFAPEAPLQANRREDLAPPMSAKAPWMSAKSALPRIRTAESDVAPPSASEPWWRRLFRRMRGG